VKMLLEWKGVSPDKPDNRGRTLMVAASRYNEVIELLQSHRTATRGAVWNPGAPPETATIHPPGVSCSLKPSLDIIPCGRRKSLEV